MLQREAFDHRLHGWAQMPWERHFLYLCFLCHLWFKIMVAGFGFVGDDRAKCFLTTSRMGANLTPTDYDDDYNFWRDTQTANASVDNQILTASFSDSSEVRGLITGLPKFAGEAVRRRGSSPKLQVFNTALMSAMEGLSPEEIQQNRSAYGSESKASM
jgi:hypothetical protein